MCGIAGIVSTQNIQQQHVINLMLNLMKHRGPDGSQSYIYQNLVLGHTRLAIIDPSVAASCPFIIDDRFVLTYNGECYNYLELQQQLISLGHNFTTSSDTEVILRSYIQWGSRFIEKVNGIFAFAIFDKKKNTLLLYRDRAGVKPLYYFKDNHIFCFASEIKPILSATGKKEINHDAIPAYFNYRYVPGNQTLFKNIYSMRPGSILEFDLSSNRFSNKQYWSISNIPPDHSLTPTKAQEAFIEILADSCKLQLRSDFPVGIFLSGGIDSTAIAALSSLHADDLESFTLNMNSGINEVPQAQTTAKELGISNRSVDLLQTDFSYYRDAIFHLEEPLGDSILAPTYKLAQFASKTHRVILSGEGADEILNGYIHHQTLLFEDRIFSLLPHLTPQIIAKCIQILPLCILEKLFAYPAKLGKNGRQRVATHLKNYDSGTEAYNSLAQIFYGDYDLYFTRPPATDHHFSSFLESSPHSIIEKVTALDLSYWMPNYTLQRLDKLTMAHGIEARVPFLDHRLIELTLSFPLKIRQQLMKNKNILRKSLVSKIKLNSNIIKRPKTPFFLPIEESFSQKEMYNWIGDYLNPSRLKARHYYKPDAIINLLNKQNKDLFDHKKLMSLALFEVWHQAFFE